MWGQKFGFVIGNALTFPFSHFSKIRGLFFSTFIFVALAIIVMLLLLNHAVAIFSIPSWGEGTGVPGVHGTGITGGLILALILIGIFIFLAILPFRVGMIRSAILDEHADTAVITAIFGSRSMGYLWANIKIFLMVIVIFLPFLVLVFLTAGAAILQSGMALHGGQINEHVPGAVGLLLLLVYLATIITTIVLVPRWLMAPVTASLNKGTSLRESRALTKGSWWLMVLSLLFVTVVVGIAAWIVSFVVGLLLTPLFVFLPPVVGIVIGGVLLLLLILFASIPSLASMGYLYLVMTDQVNFGVVERKKAKK